MRIGSNENTARRQAGRVFARSIRTNDTPVCFPTQKKGGHNGDPAFSTAVRLDVWSDVEANIVDGIDKNV